MAPAALLGSAAHVFVDDLDHPSLGEADQLHLSRSLRLRDGEVVTVSDGRGSWRSCRFESPSRGPGTTGEARLHPDGPVSADGVPSPRIRVCFSLTTGAGADWAVQRLTEIGVDAMTPITSARTSTRWGPDRAQRHVERLRRVAREAAMQARRTWLPSIDGLASFEDLVRDSEVARLGSLAHFGGEAPTLERPVVLTGPEGGWEDEELTCGLPHVGLGPTVLRAETATVFAGMILSSLRCGLVSAPGGRS